jgi:hypothetical protein
VSRTATGGAPFVFVFLLRLWFRFLWIWRFGFGFRSLVLWIGSSGVVVMVGLVEVRRTMGGLRLRHTPVVLSFRAVPIHLEAPNKLDKEAL